MNPGARFLAAFNEIESHFRTVLKVGDHVEFAQMAREYADKKRLPRQQRDTLAAFASLRNAISHGRYYGGRPIAEPVAEVVQQIETLRDQIKAPPTALAILGVMDVCTARLDEPISTALEHVRRFDYSQLPVYDGGTYAGLITTNAIARWLADQMAESGGLAEVEAVRRVLEFAEPHERALHVARSISAAEAVYQLSYGGQAGKPASALIITAAGKITEKPLAVVVAEDLPALTTALAIA